MWIQVKVMQWVTLQTGLGMDSKRAIPTMSIKNCKFRSCQNVGQADFDMRIRKWWLHEGTD